MAKPMHLTLREARAIAAEKDRRANRFSIEKFCFPEQVRFIRDKAIYKTAVCSRRAGKTVSGAAYLIDSAIARPGVVCLYITLSRLNAKRIIWGDLLKINREYSLGGKPNETELSIRFPNESVIYLSGAKDKSEVEKFRGVPNLVLVLLDEGQAFRSYIEDMVDDVLAKTLYDYNGTLCVMGTPSPVPAGYFHSVAHSPKWSHHVWTMFQNPHLQAKSGKTPMQLVQQDCERMGVSLEDPKIQRECFGRWIIDINNLVFRYQEGLNGFKDAPDRLTNFVIGVDVGFDDCDAIAVLGWANHDARAFLVEEVVTAKQGITELAGQLEKLIKKYDPMSVVMDTGGLGKKIAEEIRKRYSLPIKAAEKVRKFEFIELLNDAMRTQRFFARANGVFAQDCNLVEWDKDKSNGDKLIISDSYHSDICDAVLYAFRESLHWIEQPKAPAPKPGEHGWLDRENEKHVEYLEQQLIKQEDDDPATWEIKEWQ